MPVRLIPCRHRESGAFAEIPETALYLFGDFERVDQDEPEFSEPAGRQEQAPPDSEKADSAADMPSKQASTGRTSKAAASAKKTEED